MKFLVKRKPMKIIFNPKTGRYKSRKHESIYSGRIIQQKKQCPSCPHLRQAKVVSSIDSIPTIQVPLSCFSGVASLKKGFITKSSAKENSTRKDKVFGICTWSIYWKVLYKVKKPRKCSKVSG
ncbi:hypothetical protein KJA14_02560 [Patescibacteria group bacterium]|nr:hypothetical protein [Patescibacteria group bacterium]